MFVVKMISLAGLSVAGPAAVKVAMTKTSLTFTEASSLTEVKA